MMTFRGVILVGRRTWLSIAAVMGDLVLAKTASGQPAIEGYADYETFTARLKKLADLNLIKRHVAGIAGRFNYCAWRLTACGVSKVRDEFPLESIPRGREERLQSQSLVDMEHREANPRADRAEGRADATRQAGGARLGATLGPPCAVPQTAKQPPSGRGCLLPIAVVMVQRGLGICLTSRAVMALVSSARTIARETGSIAVCGASAPML